MIIDEQWDFQPSQQSSGVMCPKLGCFLMSGDFIRYKEGEKVQVGRIHATSDKGDIKVNCWIHKNDLLAAEQGMIGTVNSNTHPFVMGMEEVVQTNCFVHINIAEDLVGHAFVFHFDSIQDSRHPVNGIACAYSTRFRIVKQTFDLPGVCIVIEDDDHDPFIPGPCHSSEGELIYDGLMLVGGLMREILYTKRQFQPFRSNKKSSLSRNVWAYICSEMSDAVTYSTTKRARVRRQYFQDLSLNKISEVHVINSFKATTTDSFIALRRVFGKNFGLGVRKNFSDVEGTKTAHLVLGDVVNAVGFPLSDDYDNDDDVVSHINGNEISMKYDITAKLFEVTIAFTRIVMSSSDDSKSIMHAIDFNLFQPVLLNSLTVGTFFYIGSRAYRVHHNIDNINFTCIRQSRDGLDQPHKSKILTGAQIREHIINSK